MRKSVVIIFFSVLILTIFFLAAYFLSNLPSEKNKTSSYRIYSDANNFNSYPYMAWEDITSGKLLDFLNNEDLKGKLLKIPPSAETGSILESTTPGFYNTNGFAYVKLSEKDITSNKYKNKDLKSFRFVAFFKTNLGGIPYLVLVEKWLNADGSTAFLPLIVPESLSLKDNKISSYYTYLISNDSGAFLSPIYQFKDYDACKNILPKRQSYCDWYFHDPKTGNTLLGIMNAWVQTGNMQPRVGSIPMVFTATKLVSD